MAKNEMQTGILYADKALNKIDECLFSGATFYDKHNGEVLERYIERWRKRLRDIKEMREKYGEEDIG
ncbi:hypothetical protein HFN89_01090 [Rhizobium laguerreae]|nr:hypothetical protein [Rhizobium laguerreae]